MDEDIKKQYKNLTNVIRYTTDPVVKNPKIQFTQ